VIPKPLANAIIGIVTVVWSANFIAQFVPGLGYHPDPAIHGVFMAVVGGALALSRKDAKGTKNTTSTSNGGGDR
jgi:hypothetical protein